MWYMQVLLLLLYMLILKLTSTELAWKRVRGEVLSTLVGIEISPVSCPTYLNPLRCPSPWQYGGNGHVIHRSDTRSRHGLSCGIQEALSYISSQSIKSHILNDFNIGID